MATMNVSLPGEIVAFVESEVRGGRYASSSDLVRDAILLLQRDAGLEAERLSVLRQAIGVGLAALEDGQLSTVGVADIVQEVLTDGSPH